jgi:hypothetical protein
MPEQLMSELDVIELPDGTSHKVKGDVISVLIPRKDRKCWVELHLQISRDNTLHCYLRGGHWNSMAHNCDSERTFDLDFYNALESEIREDMEASDVR